MTKLRDWNMWSARSSSRHSWLCASLSAKFVQVLCVKCCRAAMSHHVAGLYTCYRCGYVWVLLVCSMRCVVSKQWSQVSYLHPFSQGSLLHRVTIAFIQLYASLRQQHERSCAQQELLYRHAHHILLAIYHYACAVAAAEPLMTCGLPGWLLA